MNGLDLSYLLEGGWAGFRRVAVKEPIRGGWTWFSPPVAGNGGNLSINLLELWLRLALMDGYPQADICTVNAQVPAAYDSFDLSTLDALRRPPNEP